MNHQDHWPQIHDPHDPDGRSEVVRFMSSSGDFEPAEHIGADDKPNPLTPDPARRKPGEQ
jgi:hypothetical protein